MLPPPLAPGGGSVAALCGALAGALTSMVANLTHGKNQYRQHWDQIEIIGVRGQELKIWFLAAIDRDTQAFNQVMMAMKLPKESSDEVTLRVKQLEIANQNAAQVPLEVMEKCVELVPLLEDALYRGNPNCISDIGVGGYCMICAAEGAALNVLANLKNVKDQEFIRKSRERLERTISLLRQKSVDIAKVVEAKLLPEHS
ncbi:MAG: cyclodeaminase/cyclohydrolase family protein [Oligoflexia bacterium]|nr:cyclodeaminase/cyclohydrolase family protein [Oligoflexia bacterium]